MPNTSSTLTREQLASFALLESTLPIVHYALHDSQALTRSEENQFFTFYVTLKRIQERLEMRQ